MTAMRLDEGLSFGGVFFRISVRIGYIDFGHVKDGRFGLCVKTFYSDSGVPVGSGEPKGNGQNEGLRFGW
jgi:hypothetical protein